MKNTSLAIMVIALACFMLSRVNESIAAVTLAFYCLTSTLPFLLIHTAQHVWIGYLSRLGYFQKNVLVIGNPDSWFPIASYFQDVAKTRKYAGTIGFETDRSIFSIRGAQKKYIRSLEDIKAVMSTNYTGQMLFFSGPQFQKHFLLSLVEICRGFEISNYVVPDISQVTNTGLWGKLFPHVPILDAFTVKRESLLAFSVKRLIDLIIAVIGLHMFLRFGLLISIVIMVENRGPIFYVRARIGKGRMRISFIKFRTMCVGADRQREQLLA